MTATYFHRQGAGHSRRGAVARELGASSWSKLPSGMKRGLTSKQAEDLQISAEWHHAGKFANRVFVYHPDAVERFFEVCETSGLTIADLQSYTAMRNDMVMGRGNIDEIREKVAIVGIAQNEAEQVREEIMEDC